MHVTEGISGTWFYHLSEDGKTFRALCGAKTMHTNVPLSAWGTRSHLNERWCETCKAIADERGG